MSNLVALLRRHWMGPILILGLVGLFLFLSHFKAEKLRAEYEAREAFHQDLSSVGLDRIGVVRELLSRVVEGSLIKYKSGIIVRVLGLGRDGCAITISHFHDRGFLCPDNEKGMLAVDDIVVGPEPAERYGTLAKEFWFQKETK